ncbi:hypothetical protein Dimus_003265 [Dionaea muscipula]
MYIFIGESCMFEIVIHVSSPPKNTSNVCHESLHAYCFFTSANYTKLKYTVLEAARLLYIHSQHEEAEPMIQMPIHRLPYSFAIHVYMQIEEQLDEEDEAATVRTKVFQPNTFASSMANVCNQGNLNRSCFTINQRSLPLSAIHGVYDCFIINGDYFSLNKEAMKLIHGWEIFHEQLPP